MAWRNRVTANKRFKRRVRARAARTGESYATARRVLAQPRGARATMSNPSIPNPLANGVDEAVVTYVLEEHDVLIGAATAEEIYAFGPARGRPGASVVDKTPTHVTVRGLDPTTSALREAVIDRAHLHRHIDQLVVSLPFDVDGRSILDAARAAASTLSQTYVGTEHFIVAFDDHRASAGSQLIARAGGDIAAARARLAAFLTPPTAGGPTISPGWTPRSVRAINFAVAEAGTLGRTVVASDLLAVGVVADGEGLGAQALASTGVSLNGARAALT